MKNNNEKKTLSKRSDCLGVRSLIRNIKIRSLRSNGYFAMRSIKRNRAELASASGAALQERRAERVNHRLASTRKHAMASLMSW